MIRLFEVFYLKITVPKLSIHQEKNRWAAEQIFIEIDGERFYAPGNTTHNSLMKKHGVTWKNLSAAGSVYDGKDECLFENQVGEEIKPSIWEQTRHLIKKAFFKKYSYARNF